MMRRLLLSLVLLVCAHAASGQSFPNKPIRLIAPFAAGGALDLIARGLGAKLAASMGQPVVVENRAGASGAIGSEAVARSAPDGYTLLLGATTTHGVNPALNPRLQYDPVRDFTPVSLVEMTAAEPDLKSGKLKALATATAQRVPGLSLPTVDESGYPGFEVTSWYAIFGPAGMPADLTSKLSAEIAKAVNETDLRDR